MSTAAVTGKHVSLLCSASFAHSVENEFTANSPALISRFVIGVLTLAFNIRHVVHCFGTGEL